MANNASISLLTVAALLGIYGYSVRNREYCVICHKTPPCLTFENCNANNIEGHILQFIFGK